MPAEILFWNREISCKFEKINNVLRNINISFDMDGVEINSAKPAIKKLNNIFSTDYTTDDLVSYWTMVDWIKKLRPDLKDPKEFARDLWNSDDVMKQARPESGAWLLSRKLEDNQIRPHRITMRPAKVRLTTLNWYKENMKWVDSELIHIQDQTDYDLGYKVDRINELGINLHFDDSVDDAENIVAHTKANVVLVPQPSNLNYINSNPRIFTPNLLGYGDMPKMIAVYLSLNTVL